MKVHTDESAVPPELRPTLRMVACAFGDELPDSWYYPLMILLAKNLSFRQGAKLFAYMCGVKYSEAYDDILGVDSKHPPPYDPGDLAEVEQRLRRCGYEEWSRLP
jgi:hypothetical protein